MPAEGDAASCRAGRKTELVPPPLLRGRVGVPELPSGAKRPSCRRRLNTSAQGVS